MKKLPRIAWQEETDTHVFGFTSDEAARAADHDERNPEMHAEHVLIDAGISKAECYGRLAAARIDLPRMYALGFEHNNCLGCVKATSPGYWNRTRRLFPEVFARRAAQSRALGVKLARVDNVRVFLDVLPPDIGGADDDVECGPVCQLPMVFA